MRTDHSRLEVGAEVDSNTSGPGWAWTIKDDGSVGATGSATTSRASHSSEVCTAPVGF